MGCKKIVKVGGDSIVNFFMVKLFKPNIWIFFMDLIKYENLTLWGRSFKGLCRGDQNGGFKQS